MDDQNGLGATGMKRTIVMNQKQIGIKGTIVMNRTGKKWMIVMNQEWTGMK